MSENQEKSETCDAEKFNPCDYDEALDQAYETWNLYIEKAGRKINISRKSSKNDEKNTSNCLKTLLISALVNNLKAQIDARAADDECNNSKECAQKKEILTIEKEEIDDLAQAITRDLKAFSKLPVCLPELDTSDQALDFLKYPVRIQDLFQYGAAEKRESFNMLLDTYLETPAAPLLSQILECISWALAYLGESCRSACDELHTEKFQKLRRAEQEKTEDIGEENEAAEPAAHPKDSDSASESAGTVSESTPEAVEKPSQPTELELQYQQLRKKAVRALQDYTLLAELMPLVMFLMLHCRSDRTVSSFIQKMGEDDRDIDRIKLPATISQILQEIRTALSCMYGAVGMDCWNRMYIADDDQTFREACEHLEDLNRSFFISETSKPRKHALHRVTPLPTFTCPPRKEKEEYWDYVRRANKARDKYEHKADDQWFKQCDDFRDEVLAAYQTSDRPDVKASDGRVLSVTIFQQLLQRYGLTLQHSDRDYHVQTDNTLNWYLFEQLTGLLWQTECSIFDRRTAKLISPFFGTQFLMTLRKLERKRNIRLVEPLLEDEELRVVLYRLFLIYPIKTSHMGIRFERYQDVCEDYLTGSFPIWKDGLEKLSVRLQLKAEMNFYTDPIPEELLAPDEESVEDHADDQQESNPLNTVIWEDPILW